LSISTKSGLKRQKILQYKRPKRKSNTDEYLMIHHEIALVKIDIKTFSQP